MKLKNIQEGIVYRPYGGKTIDQVVAANPTKAGDVEYLLDAGTFVYRDIDRPDDIVKVEPIRKVTKLSSVLPKENDSLSSFDGEIMYGFKIANPKDVEYEQEEVVDYTEILQELKRVTKASNYASLKKAEADQFMKLNKTKRELETAEDPKGYEDLIIKYKENMELIGDVIDLLGQENVEDIKGLKTISKNNSKAQKAAVKRALIVLKAGLAAAVKHPQTKHQKTMQTQILKELVKAFLKNNNQVYELVLYPESRSDVGKMLATTLAKHYGSEVSKIPKLEKGKAFVYDKELMRNAENKHKRAKAGQIAKHILKRMIITPERQMHFLKKVFYDENIPATDPRWVKLWFAKEKKKLLDRNATDSKGVHSTKRRFLQRFTIEGMNLKGKDILIVDDNVHHSGTMESLNHMIQEMEPASVDMLVPFNFPKQ